MRWIVVAATLIAGGAQAEGGRITLPCTVTQVCDATGACAPASEAVTFDLAPTQFGSNGVAYTLEYSGFQGLAQLDSLNTIVWGLGETDVQRLMPTGRNSALWLSQDFGEAPVSTVRFLACEDIQ